MIVKKKLNIGMIDKEVIPYELPDSCDWHSKHSPQKCPYNRTARFRMLFIFLKPKIQPNKGREDASKKGEYE